MKYPGGLKMADTGLDFRQFRKDRHDNYGSESGKDGQFFLPDQKENYKKDLRFQMNCPKKT
jgi:hypothetical protein